MTRSLPSQATGTRRSERGDRNEVVGRSQTRLAIGCHEWLSPAVGGVIGAFGDAPTSRTQLRLHCNAHLLAKAGE